MSSSTPPSTSSTSPSNTRTETAPSRPWTTSASGWTPARFVSLVGPSGSGKSCLLAVAATLVRPTSGLVVIDGVDATGLRDRELTALRRGKVGIIFQQPNLLASLTAAEQLVIGDHLRGKPLKAARAQAAELLDVVGLAAAAHKRPHQLSGGQRQRVNIARALMGIPRCCWWMSRRRPWTTSAANRSCGCCGG